MKSIVLHESDLTNAARMMEEAAQEMEKSKKKADEIIEEIRKIWGDSKGREYREKYEKLSDNLPKLIKAVREYKDFLNKVLEKYRQFSSEVKESIN